MRLHLQNFMNATAYTIDVSQADTYLFDYGGVVAFHYCEPWQSNLSGLLNVTPQRVRELLSETFIQGKEYRLGTMTREQFWNEIMLLAGVKGIDMHALEDNWARSYQIDQRMLQIIDALRKAGNRVGIMMNTDEYRHTHIEREYALSDKVDCVVSSWIHKVVKPDQAAYQCALKLFQRENCQQKVIYFDDRERNVLPCSQLGMQGAVFADFESFQSLLIGAKVVPPHHS